MLFDCSASLCDFVQAGLDGGADVGEEFVAVMDFGPDFVEALEFGFCFTMHSGDYNRAGGYVVAAGKIGVAHIVDGLKDERSCFHLF